MEIKLNQGLSQDYNPQVHKAQPEMKATPTKEVTNKEQTVKETMTQPVKGMDKKVDEKDVIEAINKANKHIQSYNRRLEFRVHEGTKQIMVKVINTEDDSVIREIPSEKVLDMVAHMWEMAGILVDEHR